MSVAFAPALDTPAERIWQAVKRLAGKDVASHVWVETARGVAVLHGWVHTIEEEQLVRRAAERAAGNLSVKTFLALRPRAA